MPIPGGHRRPPPDCDASLPAQLVDDTVTDTRTQVTDTAGGRSLHIRIKVKVRPRQEFVVGGWHPGERGLSGKFGSLLVGVYEDDKLRYVGKVGTGYTDQERDRVGKLLADLAMDESPFDPPPPWEVSRTAHWVRPEVAFAEWTSSGTLSHPAYLGTRADKDQRQVVREA